MKRVNRDTTEMAKCIALGWGVSKDKGTKFLAMTFRVHDGEFVGALVGAELYIHENTVEQVENGLLALGWDGVKDFELLTKEDLGKVVILDIAVESFEVEDRKTHDKVKKTKAVAKGIRPLIRVQNAIGKEEIRGAFAQFQAMRDRKAATGGGGFGARPRRTDDDLGPPPNYDDGDDMRAVAGPSPAYGD